MRNHLAALMVLLSCAACSAQREPCARYIAQAKPYRGQLSAGEVYRAIVTTGSDPFAHTTMALYAAEPGPFSVEFLYFPDSGIFELEEPTLLVFRVTSSMMVHTPPDAAGSYDYFTEYFAELLAIEESQSSQIRRAQTCLEELAPEGTWDTKSPFAHGPGERGGWLIRFSSVEPPGLPAIEFEVGVDGGCHQVE